MKEAAEKASKKNWFSDVRRFMQLKTFCSNTCAHSVFLGDLIKDAADFCVAGHKHNRIKAETVSY